MAEIAARHIHKANGHNVTGLLVEWDGIGDGDTGSPIAVDLLANRTIQALDGTIAGLIIEGTLDEDLDNAVWATLKDSQGNDAIFTGAGLIELLPRCLFIRPRGDTGDSGVRVRLMAQR